MDNGIVSFGVLDILDYDVAGLKGRLPKSHLEQLYVPDLLIDVVVLSAHEFFSHHVLILADKGLLRTVKTNKHCHQINLLILDSLLGLVLLYWQDLPLLSCVLVLLTTHLFNILLRGYLHNFSCQLGIILNIISKRRDDTSEGVISLEQVILDGESYFFEDDALRINYLQHLEHVDVLVEDVLGNDSRDQQALLYLSTEILADLRKLNKGKGTRGARSRHFFKLVIVL